MIGFYNCVTEVKLWIVSYVNLVNTHYTHMDTAFTLMVLFCLAIQLPQNYPVSSTFLLT
jgi:hypothetical protein